MNTNVFLTDNATAQLSFADGPTLDEGVDFADHETVTIDDDGLVEFFGTDEFYKFESTVAKPLVQNYVIDGELVRLRKTEDELTKAVWQIDTLPWTITHPRNDRVTDTEEIRGFWRSPSYEDGQTAHGYLPVNDLEAQQFVAENPSLSVGFNPTIEWNDALFNDDGEVREASSLPSDLEYHGTQRNMVYDHVASVQNGRCSLEDGCGVGVTGDSNDTHNHITPLDEASEEALSSIADCGAVDAETTDETTTPTMCDNDNDENPFEKVVDGLSVDAVARRNDAVDEALTEKDEQISDLTDSVDSLETTIEEKEEVIDEKDERIGDLLDELTAVVDDEFDAAVEELTDLTDKFDEDELREEYDEADDLDTKRDVVDDVDEKIDLVEELSATETTLGDDVDEGGDGGDVTDNADEGPSVEATDDGRFDLRSQSD